MQIFIGWPFVCSGLADRLLLPGLSETRNIESSTDGGRGGDGSLCEDGAFDRPASAAARRARVSFVDDGLR
jgi:hypothetical protein